MDGQNLWEMEWSGYDNLFQEDEVFSSQHELPPIDFWYPESVGINYDLDATYLMDNLLETPIHSSMDVLPDPTMVSEDGLLAGQDGGFGFPNQELVTMTSLPFPDQGMPETNFSSLQTQGANSLNFSSQELSEMSFTSLLTQGMNSLDFPSQELSGTSFLCFPTQELNSLSFSSQGLSMMDPLSLPTQELYLTTLELPNQGLSMMDILSLPTQEPYMNILELPNQGLSMMDTFGLPTQEAFMNTLEFPNPGLPIMDTLGLPTQEPFINTLELPNQGFPIIDTLSFPAQEPYLNSLVFPNHNLSMMSALSFPTPEMTSLDFSNQGMFMNTLEFPHQELSMLDALSFPAQGLTSLGFPNQGTSMNTSEFPYQTQPVFMTMEDNRETEEMNMISSSDGEQSQEERDPNDGNSNGNGGGESNRSLRSTLSREMISQVFHLSITDAAKTLNVGKTLLKKRCRDLGINRWPQRKFKSLQTIITHLQEFGESSGNDVQGTITRLENEKRQMEETPDLHFDDDTIRLRQCHTLKPRWRKRRRVELHTVSQHIAYIETSKSQPFKN